MTIGPVSLQCFMANSVAFLTANTSMPSTQIPGTASPRVKYSVFDDDLSALVPMPEGKSKQKQPILFVSFTKKNQRKEKHSRNINSHYRNRYSRKQKYTAISINTPYCMLQKSGPGLRHHHRTMPSTHRRCLCICRLAQHLLPTEPTDVSFV